MCKVEMAVISIVVAMNVNYYSYQSSPLHMDNQLAKKREKLTLVLHNHMLLCSPTIDYVT
jgi:hypothetical protein